MFSEDQEQPAPFGPDKDERTDQRRLWTPWRMKYVGGGAAEEGCIFCNRLGATDDSASLILHRGERTFVVMNLYPYNTGHLMIVPTAHVATPEEADAEALAEVAALLQPVTLALRRVLNPAGFNVGMNVGEVAGAGVAAHLHMHVVPRWVGDANFMPILASTMVVPELIPVTYAKVRAELQRATQPADRSGPVSLVILGKDGASVVAHRRANGIALPTVAPEDDAVWQSAARAVQAFGLDAKLISWAGGARAGEEPPALAFTVADTRMDSGPDAAWLPVAEVMDQLPEIQARMVAAAVGSKRESVVAPPG